MPIGKLKMWNAARGFGFIQNDAGGPDMYLHASALKEANIDPDALKIGDAGRQRPHLGSALAILRHLLHLHVERSPREADKNKRWPGS